MRKKYGSNYDSLKVAERLVIGSNYDSLKVAEWLVNAARSMIQREKSLMYTVLNKVFNMTMTNW